jgi:LuxR family maltose regulon positive regulatory protein
MPTTASSLTIRAARTRRRAHGGVDPTSPPDLIEAKLLVPARHAESVRRTRLLHELRGASDRPFVSVVAPPGYGKTSLLAQWAANDPRPVAWLSVDEGDNDPAVLLAYLATAIGRTHPLDPLDPVILESIASPAISLRAVVGRLIAAIADRTQPILILIDDAQRIGNRTCLDALAEFIQHLPAGSQMAMAGRAAVGLPIARWRAEGLILEIGPDELAIDEPEAARLTQAFGLRLSAESVSRLVRQTEGWPALLALTALAAKRSTSHDSGVAAGGERLVADYLRSELLATRPKAEIVFMTQTSILEHLSGAICDAVTDRPGSAALLARLARSTLLVDEYGGSYRYHSLLRAFLQGELAAARPGLVVELHRRAAAWYEAAENIDLAVDHAFASGDSDHTSALVAKGFLFHHWSGRRLTLRSWLGRLGEEALRRHPWLAVLAAWEELAAGEVASTVRLAEIAEHGTFEGTPPDGTASFESGRAMLRAVMFRRGAEDALANALLAADLEGAGGGWRDFALWTVAIARIATGDRDGAEASLADAIDAARSGHNIGLCYCLLGHRALLAIERGDWGAAAESIEESDDLGLARAMEGYLSGAPARIARIRIEIERGEIEAARRDLARAMMVRPVFSAAAPALSVLCLIAFARAYLAVGDQAGAQAVLQQSARVIRLRPDVGVLPDEVATLRDALASEERSLPYGASSLTVAEFRVLAFLPYYLSFKEIGQRLGVTTSTVKTHAVSIYGKLGASSRGEAVDAATELGLLAPVLRARSPSSVPEDAVRRRS